MCIKKALRRHEHISVMYVSRDWHDHIPGHLEYYSSCLSYFSSLAAHSTPMSPKYRTISALSVNMSRECRHAIGQSVWDPKKRIRRALQPYCVWETLVVVFSALTETFLLPDHAMAVAMLPPSIPAYVEDGIEVRDLDVEV